MGIDEESLSPANVKQVNAVKSGGTDLTPIPLADYNARKSGFYWDAAKGGTCYINAVGNATTGFQVIAASGVVAIGPSLEKPSAQKIAISCRLRSIEVSVPFEGDHSVELFNAQGRSISKHHRNGASTFRLPLNSRSRGVYVVRITAARQTAVTCFVY